MVAPVSSSIDNSTPLRVGCTVREGLNRGPEDQGLGTGDRGPGPGTGPILLHGRLWDPHSYNKCLAPGFCSALQNTLVQLFMKSADEKQETKLLWTICIMSLRHISLQIPNYSWPNCKLYNYYYHKHSYL